MGEHSDEAGLRAAGHYFNRIGAATDAMRLLRDRVEPYFGRYFPNSGTTAGARSRAASSTQLAEDAAALKPIHDEAWSLAEEAKAAAEAIRSLDVPEPILQMAFLSSKQVTLDGSVLILLHRLVCATHEGDPEAMTYLAGPQGMLR